MCYLNLFFYIFRLALVWYLIAVFLELLFPGLISHFINLDLFLWGVILMAVITFIFKTKKA